MVRRQLIVIVVSTAYAQRLDVLIIVEETPSSNIPTIFVDIVIYINEKDDVEEVIKMVVIFVKMHMFITRHTVLVRLATFISITEKKNRKTPFCQQKKNMCIGLRILAMLMRNMWYLLLVAIESWVMQATKLISTKYVSHMHL